jgi:uncharacterized phage protein gp47/JayE
MTEYGVTPTGFVKKGYDAILTELVDRTRIYFGGALDLAPTSVFYQFMQVIALENAKQWETLEDTYYSAFVTFATGASLDALAAQFGFTRNPAQHKRLELCCSRRQSRMLTMYSSLPAGLSRRTLVYDTELRPMSYSPRNRRASRHR